MNQGCRGGVVAKETIVAGSKSVIGAMTYLSPMCKRPEIFHNTIDWRTNPHLQTHKVTITDLRCHRNEVKLSTNGFELFDHRSDVTDFASEAQIAQIYVPEAKSLIKAVTGAQQFYATKVVLRLNDPRQGRGDAAAIGAEPPLRIVHADYVREDFHKFARLHRQDRRQFADETEPERWRAGRYAAFNVWRVVSPPPHDCPLAFIDRRTIAPADMVEGLAESFGTVFFTWGAHHRWGYFSNMTRDEVVVFLNFDSADDALPGPPHSAFDDPTCPVDVPPRLSCEVHIYAYWE
jgi:hypothetical protein